MFFIHLLSYSSIPQIFIQQISDNYLHNNEEMINAFLGKHYSKRFSTTICFILVRILGYRAVIISIMQRGQLSTDEIDRHVIELGQTEVAEPESH